MEQLPRYAIMTELIKCLRNHHSWCGETHIQKATYFLQDLLGVPTGFDFILYKHGPFSFDLHDELAAMRAYQLIEIVPQPPYGPSWYPTTNSDKLQENYPVTLEKYQPQIEFVASKLGNKRVSELEKLATALFVTRENSSKDDQQLAARIHELKPHVSTEDALAALQEFYTITNEAKAISQ